MLTKVIVTSLIIYNDNVLLNKTFKINIFHWQDTAGSVKLWEITKGIVVADYGKVTLVLFLVVFDNNIFVDMVGVPDWHKGRGSSSD